MYFFQYVIIFQIFFKLIKNIISDKKRYGRQNTIYFLFAEISIDLWNKKIICSDIENYIYCGSTKILFNFDEKKERLLKKK